MSTTKPEALRLAEWLQAAAELRRLHAENADLRAELASIGAGGVSALMGAANAGSEPVATGMVAVCGEDANRYCEILRLLGMEEEGDPVAEVHRLQDRAAHAIWSIWEALPGYLIDHCEGEPVSEEMLQRVLAAMLAYPKFAAPDWAAHPSPPEGMAGWMPIETAPKNKTNVILLRQACGSVANGFWLAEAYAGNGSWIWPYVHKNPTHWMPAPPHPSHLRQRRNNHERERTCT